MPVCHVQLLDSLTHSKVIVSGYHSASQQSLLVPGSDLAGMVVVWRYHTFCFCLVIP